jgi:hypothetical protein
MRRGSLAGKARSDVFRLSAQEPFNDRGSLGARAGMIGFQLARGTRTGPRSALAAGHHARAGALSRPADTVRLEQSLVLKGGVLLAALDTRNARSNCLL